MYNNNYGRPPRRIRKDQEVMSFGKWIGTFILLSIPGINVIAWLVWLFGGGQNKNRTNWVRASLLFTVIVGAIGAVVYFLLWTTITAFLSSKGINIPAIS